MLYLQGNMDASLSLKRTVSQYHFTSWPDFGVPKSPSGILKFLRKIKHSSPTGYGPIVVHCRYPSHLTYQILTVVNKFE